MAAVTFEQIQQFWDSWQPRLATYDPGQLTSAVEAIEELPPPSGEPADPVACIIHEVARHAESLQDWQLCAALYQRVLQYPVNDRAIHAGAWYRYGLCREKCGRFAEAICAYRSALLLGEAWPEVAALSRRSLAELLMAMEEYREAAELWQHVAEDRSLEDAERAHAALCQARCLIQLGENRQAQESLKRIGENADSDTALQALYELARICESDANLDEARHYYQRILEASFSEPSLRLAAALKLRELRSR